MDVMDHKNLDQDVPYFNDKVRCVGNFSCTTGVHH